jgi:hypothetical protein
MSSEFLLSRFVFAFPVIVFAAFAGLKLVATDVYESLVSEDSSLEYLQFALYFLAAIAAALTAHASLRKHLNLLSSLYAGLALVLLIVALEEISWGQRIFGIENPEFFETHNLQGETTLHNLPVVQSRIHIAYILLGLFGAVAWLPVRWLRLRRFRLVDAVVPEWYLSPYFFFTALVYAVIAYVAPRMAAAFGIEWLEIDTFFTWRDQEPAELLLAMGFLLFTLDAYRKANDRWTSTAASSSAATGLGAAG